MLTVFSVPKPFVGRAASIQRRAVESWRELTPDVQVVLVGDEPWLEEQAAAHGVASARTGPGDGGTPRLDGVFAAAGAVAAFEFRCFVNADVVLGPDLVAAARRVRDAFERFLLVGQSWDLEPDLVPGDPAAVREVALRQGRLRGAAALDWFVFPAGLLDPIPPFLVGRAGYDNWLVWRARQRGSVVDATAAVVAVHQTHAYDHLPGGKEAAYYGAEAARNVELAGGGRRLFTLHDASHRLLADHRLRRNPGALLRGGETLRKVKWKLGVR